MTRRTPTERAQAELVLLAQQLAQLRTAAVLVLGHTGMADALDRAIEHADSIQRRLAADTEPEWSP